MGWDGSNIKFDVNYKTQKIKTYLWFSYGNGIRLDKKYFYFLTDQLRNRRCHPKAPGNSTWTGHTNVVLGISD